MNKKMNPSPLIVLASRRKTKKEKVEQLKLEMELGMRRELREMEESIAVALSKGTTVEPGVHTAELVMVRDDDGVPVRDESGQLSLKLVIQ